MIKEGFFPIKNDKEEWLVTKELGIFERRTLDGLCILDLADGDMLLAEDLSTSNYESIFRKKNTENIEQNNLFYIKAYVFSARPHDSVIDAIRELYSSGADKYCACILADTVKREVFSTFGIVFPYQRAVDILRDSLRNYKNTNTDINIEGIIVKGLEGPKSEVIDDDDENETPRTNQAAYVYLMLFLFGLAIKLWVGAFGYYIPILGFGDSDFLFLGANLIHILTIGKVVENNFGSRKFIFISFVGGLIAGLISLSIGFAYFYNWLLPANGAIFYIRYRVPDLFERKRFICYFNTIYILLVFFRCLFMGNVIGLLGLSGVVIGFIFAGILGFERESLDMDLKKNLIKLFITSVLLGISATILRHTLLYE